MNTQEKSTKKKKALSAVNKGTHQFTVNRMYRNSRSRTAVFDSS